MLKLLSFVWLLLTPVASYTLIRKSDNATPVGSQSEWLAHAARVRQAILVGAQLDPLPARSALHAQIAHVRKREGFSVSDVAFESAPGFYVFGNLYRPLTSGNGRHPAILVPHGHFKDKLWYARARPENQILCAQLARMGAVVFTYDMVGWGDSQQVSHSAPNVLQLQLWDSIRALDFVSTLPDVDDNHIGVTGASGGATQAIYLAAVDNRIHASMPVVMVSSHYTGHERCEDGMPVHDLPDGSRSTNVEIAASIAPRPLLIVSDGDDWTKHFPAEDFPLVRQIYTLFPAALPPSNVHFPEGRHDYGPSKRQVAYRFFSTVFGLRLLPVPSVPDVKSDRDSNPEDIDIEKQRDQAVLKWIKLPDAARPLGESEIANLFRERCYSCYVDSINPDVAFAKPVE